MSITTETSHGVLSLGYMKVLRVVLLTGGCWSDEPFGKKSPFLSMVMKKSIALQTATIFAGSAYYLAKRENADFFLVSHIIITFGIGIVMITRSVLTNFKRYDHCIKEFTEFHLINYRHKGIHYEKMYNLADKVSRGFSIVQMLAAAIASALFNISPLYTDYKLGAFSHPRPKNVTMDFALFFQYPGFQQDDYFYIASAINAYFSYHCSVFICIMDLFLFLAVFQIVAHIKILILEIETMKRPKKMIDVSSLQLERYDKEENEAIRAQLKEMVDHHRHIVGFAGNLSDFFGPMLALNYFFHLTTDCILLILCSRKDPKTLARFGPLMIALLAQLIEMSVIFEFVGHVSEKLIDSLYCSPWECMNIPNQRTVKFFLHRIQKPIQVTAMGIVPVGVKTMLGIFKTTLSYYAILESLQD